MWNPRDLASPEKKGVNGIVAVAIDRDRSSQHALKWAIDHILARGQTVVLIHVRTKPVVPGSDLDSQTKELFLPFRCFCTRKDIQFTDVILEDPDIAKALIQHVANNGIEHLVLGASSRSGLLRFKSGDVPSTISKSAPEFCTVYVISKGKISSMRSASHPAPTISALYGQMLTHSQSRSSATESDLPEPNSVRDDERSPVELPQSSRNSEEFIRHQLTKGRTSNGRYPLEILPRDRDDSIFSVSSGRTSIDFQYLPSYNNMESDLSVRLSDASDMDYKMSFESFQRSLEATSPHRNSSVSGGSEARSPSANSSPMNDDVEVEMQRLKLELKQTMEMYSAACREALIAKKTAEELEQWKAEEERRLKELRVAGEAALMLAQKERAKSKAAMEAAEVARRVADMEAHKRRNAEMKAIKEAEEKKKIINSLGQSYIQYRKYTIEEIEAATDFFAKSRKIGEGGYGPVYKGYLDHTPVAIKILRPDAAQGRSQFQQEVEVLSCIRHPNMVLLLGACPEYGCLVYEFMGRGSLEDRLFRRGGGPPLSWQVRFKIAAEIGTALLFLHQAKPEPIVHRDLKPANILLDRNFVSKISDVGLARLVPPSIADTVTQYRLTATAGTFCYIDPEYQQTGMLGVKSDVYSLGIMYLQIITAKPAMGLTHIVEQAIEDGRFEDALDPDVPDWPMEETLRFAKLALKCSELRRKDRPDLGKVVLPELNRLRALAEESIHLTLLSAPTIWSSSGISQSQVSLSLVSQ
ncbi:hypothetical protein CDL15_Pgr028880 [Punica granatum]|uniref:RING-type E3 ubiquitin transferase n=2 Tax=Punica granatum TaxID=22663 RepID=A0A218WX61_PUNGR|nr:hypothetical protein CDL15_Pgr028880 [Punica granatum]